MCRCRRGRLVVAVGVVLVMVAGLVALPAGSSAARTAVGSAASAPTCSGPQTELFDNWNGLGVLDGARRRASAPAGSRTA